MGLCIVAPLMWQRGYTRRDFSGCASEVLTYDPNRDSWGGILTKGQILAHKAFLVARRRRAAWIYAQESLGQLCFRAFFWRLRRLLRGRRILSKIQALKKVSTQSLTGPRLDHRGRYGA